MAFIFIPTNRGVQRDVDASSLTAVTANIKGGFVKPNQPVLVHAESQKIALTNANLLTNSRDMLSGCYYESETLTANRTLTLPPASSIIAYLINILKTSSTGITCARFSFVLDNTQAGAFTRTLVAGAGMTLQGVGFDVSQNEIALFDVFVSSSSGVVISRSNLGDSTVETLAETLVAGNVTGGTDIEITSGDSITGTGQIPIISSQAAVNALRLQSSNAAGGIDIDAGTGGIAMDTTGALSLDSAASSNLSTTTGTMTISSTDASAAGVVSISSSGTGLGAVAIVSAGGIDIDYAAASTSSIASGGTIISTFGTSAAPNLTVNNGHLIFSTVTRGIQNGPTNGTIVANAVTVNGTAGTITDSGVVASGSRAQITVTNTSVAATSQIFVQASGDATVARSASLLLNPIAGAGSFTLDVFNTDAINATAGTPVYHFFIVNPV